VQLHESKNVLKESRQTLPSDGQGETPCINKALFTKLKKLKGKRVEMPRKSRKQTRKQLHKQCGGEGMGQPLKYMNASYQEPSASAGSNLQGIVPLTLAREALNVKPMVGGQILSPMSFQEAYHGPPLAPTGQSLTDLVMPPTLRQGLNLGKMAGGRRRKASRGGFYPSIMGGVISNAPLLAPLAARQGLELFSQYKTSTRRRRSSRKQTRKTARRRSSGRR
jgi:hypothetical protein